MEDLAFLPSLLLWLTPHFLTYNNAFQFLSQWLLPRDASWPQVFCSAILQTLLEILCVQVCTCVFLLYSETSPLTLHQTLD